MVLWQRIDRIVQKRTALMSRLASLDEELLSRHPKPLAWSILEIVEHLVLAEEDVFGELSTLDTRPVHHQHWQHYIRYWLVLSILRFNIPVQAPSRAMLPTGKHTLSALDERWANNQAYLRQFVEPLDRIGAKRAICQHPVIGPLTIAQSVRLLEIHMDRHIRQIRSTEKRLAKNC